MELGYVLETFHRILRLMKHKSILIVKKITYIDMIVFLEGGEYYGGSFIYRVPWFYFGATST